MKPLSFYNSTRFKHFITICVGYLYLIEKSYLSNEIHEKYLRQKNAAKNRNKNLNAQEIEEKIRVSLEELGIYKIPQFLVLYQIYSTCMHIINFSVLTLAKLIGFRPFGFELTCFWGRVVLHENVPQEQMIWFSWILSGIHLSWRSYALLHLRKLALKTIELNPYVLCEQSLLEQALDLSCRNRKVGEKESLEVLRDSLLIKTSCPFGVETVKLGSNKAEYFARVRPNRTLKARKELDQVATISFRITFLSIICSSFIILTAIRANLFSQSISYEGCPNANADKTTAIYWWRLLTSSEVTFVQAIDNFVASAATFHLAALVSADLLLYWRHIHETILTLRRKFSTQTIVYVKPQQYEFGHCLHNMRKSSLAERSTNTCDSDELNNLKESLLDFFSFLRRSDKLMSFQISLWLCTWLMCITIAALTGLKTSTNILLVRIIATVVCVVVLSVCFLTVQVKRAVESSYATLCGLITFSSVESRLSWLKAMDYYAPMKRYGLTIFGGGMLTQLTCLKLISYSLTIIVVVDTIFIRSSTR